MEEWIPRLVPVTRILTLSVVGLGLLIFFAQRWVAFPGARRDPGRARAVAPQGIEQLWLETSYGRVEAWFFPAGGEGPRTTVIFAHGNGELIDDWAHAMSELAESGLNAVAVEFPGYGFSAGTSSRRTIREAFDVAFDRMAGRPDVDPDRIVAFGRSMGGGAAGDLALDRPVAALILLSTFSSAMAVARSTLVPGILVRDRFDNVTAIEGFQGPVLLMHGPTDDVLPFSHAQTLSRAREGLEITTLPCAHNDCARAWPDIRAHIVTFLGVHHILEP